MWVHRQHLFQPRGISVGNLEWKPLPTKDPRGIFVTTIVCAFMTFWHCVRHAKGLKLSEITTQQCFWQELRQFTLPIQISDDSWDFTTLTNWDNKLSQGNGFQYSRPLDLGVDSSSLKPTNPTKIWGEILLHDNALLTSFEVVRLEVKIKLG